MEIEKNFKCHTKEWKLIEVILKFSESKKWIDAKEEWREKERYLIKKKEDYISCSCGHYPIKEVIIILNIINKNELVIGNCCINKIFGIDCDEFFKSLKNKRCNIIVTEQGFKDDVINEWEYNFMISIWKKRNFTLKQKNVHNEIVQKLINKYIK